MFDAERKEYELEIKGLKEELQEKEFENGVLRKKIEALEFCTDISPFFEKMFMGDMNKSVGSGVPDEEAIF